MQIMGTSTPESLALLQVWGRQSRPSHCSLTWPVKSEPFQPSIHLFFSLHACTLDTALPLPITYSLRRRDGATTAL